MKKKGDHGREGAPLGFAFRSLAGFLAVLTGTVLCAAVLGLGVFMYLNLPPKEAPVIPAGVETLAFGDDGALIFDVRNGESAASVGRRLEEAGLIKSALLWSLLFRAGSETVKAGVYSLALPLSQLEIRSILVSGRQLLVRVTFPEGGTLKKSAGILEEAGICPAGEFLAAAGNAALRESYGVGGETMEGYLYPDTYLFPRAYPAGQVVKTMADTFFKRLAAIDARILGLSREELNRTVIVASIVEREYRVAAEAPLMAGVFYNRLRIGMALQSCATVEYVITEIQDRPHPDVLYNRDIELRDPYNTYIRPGLPPGPISAPGETALRAALYPESSNYLYFRLIDPGAGRHYFSQTLDDHIKAGVLYVKRSSF
ncbi:MAG: endolytic transglycosylase MltG [Spirochaetaceae bacterium]|nr:endolytic transglycosylase MltG [Spirochaetaceae bacterium]